MPLKEYSLLNLNYIIISQHTDALKSLSVFIIDIDTMKTYFSYRIVLNQA